MPRFEHTLSYKSPLERGTRVLHAQRALSATGFLRGDLDGLFGAQTLAAVKQFQVARNLVANGEIDEITWNALFQVAPTLQGDGGLESLVSRLSIAHQFEDSVSWRLTDCGIAVDNEPAVGTPGRPVTVEFILKEFGSLIDEVCGQLLVPKELVVATIATESRGNAAARREEPGFASDTATPGKVSVGLMQTLISTARAQVADADVTAAWLLVPRNSIFAGAKYIAAQKSVTSFDPPKVACAYNAGGLYHEPSAANRWRLRQYPIGTSAHADRFIGFFNDCITYLRQRGPHTGEYSFASLLQKGIQSNGLTALAGVPVNPAQDACARYMADNHAIDTGEVTVPRGANFALRSFACGGQVNIAASFRPLGGAQPPQAIGTLTNVTDNPQTLSLAQISLQPPGSYFLAWSIDGTVEDWKVVSELLIEGVPRYRHLLQRTPMGSNTEMMFVTVT